MELIKNNFVKIFLLLIILCRFLLVSAFAQQSAPSLCHRDEQQLFNCPARGKIISICATQNLSKSEGSVLYRFGRLGKVELEYPSLPQHPSKSFRGFFEQWAKGNAEQISFSVGAKTYVVYHYSSVFAENGAGVAVYERGRRLAKIACDNDNPKENLFTLESFSLEEAPAYDDLP
jgi:hypothetical protein